MAANLDIQTRELPMLLTINEAAELLRLSTKAVYDLARRKSLPGCRKIGGTWRIHRDTLLKHIASGQGA